MIELIIAITAFFASILTLYSGFGLGTILMPVIAIFFPITIAVALTAVVHFLNNLLKLSVLWRDINWGITCRFGIPAIITTVPGAWLLTELSAFPALYSYNIIGLTAIITPVKFTVGLLLIFFATVEWLPIFKKINFSQRAIPLGGLLSGFFGGLSGHQGAFRSAFLINVGLDKNQFVATNAAIAALVDVTRLVIYGMNIALLTAHIEMSLILVVILASFLGVLVGKSYLKKVTIGFIQKVIAVMLYMLGLLLAMGII